MASLNLKTVYFTEEEDFDSTKEKLTKLISGVDNDLVENDDNKETFLEWFMKENKNLLEENYGSFLALFLDSVREHVERNGGIAFEYDYLNDELVYGYVISTAAAHE